MINCSEYIKLPFKDKEEILMEEGEHQERLDEFMDVYLLFDFYVFTARSDDREIISITASQLGQVDQ